jgi:hypothetical protein
MVGYICSFNPYFNGMWELNQPMITCVISLSGVSILILMVIEFTEIWNVGIKLKIRNTGEKDGRKFQSLF